MRSDFRNPFNLQERIIKKRRLDLAVQGTIEGWLVGNFLFIQKDIKKTHDNLQSTERRIMNEKDKKN